MPNKKKSMVYPAIFMIVLSAILTFILAGINTFTKPIVELNEVLNVQQKVLYVFEIENDGTKDGMLEAFSKNVKESDKTFNDEPVYIYEKDGKVQGYAVFFRGNGLWGPIEGYVAFNEDYSELLGLDFTFQQETPGLGGRIEEEAYKSQYRNVPAVGFDKDVDGISGATGTSNAVNKLLNENISEILKQLGGSN